MILVLHIMMKVWRMGIKNLQQVLGVRLVLGWVDWLLLNLV